jgi:hypothetical protein
MAAFGTFGDVPSGSVLGPDETDAFVGAFVLSPVAGALAFLMLSLIVLPMLARSASITAIEQAPAPARSDAPVAGDLLQSTRQRVTKPRTGAANRRFVQSRSVLPGARGRRGHLLDLRDLGMKSSPSLERGPPR